MTENKPDLLLEDRIDLACDRFESSWGSDDPVEIEEVLTEFPDSETPPVLLELLAVERELRMRAGETFRKQDYVSRLPKHSELVSKFFDSHRPPTADLTTTKPPPIAAPRVAPPSSTQAGGAAKSPDRIGKYRIVEALDRGGQATVYRAVHPELGRDVVIKFCHRPGDPTARRHEALRAEAQILADLDHPNLARVYDFDFHEGRAYVVMEFVRGLNLAQYFKQHVPSEQQWIPMVRDVCRALQYVHERGILHLDIKPQNILIDDTGKPKLIDFGLARMDSIWKQAGPDAEIICGTFRFMPPEVARGDADLVGPASDVFAIGGVMFFLVTGKTPIREGGFDRVLQDARDGEWDRQQLDVGHPSPGIRALIESSLSVEPKQRPASAAELASQLQGLIGSSRRWVVTGTLLTAFASIAGVTAAMLWPGGTTGPPLTELQVRVWRSANQIDALIDSLPVATDQRLEIRSTISPGVHASLFLFSNGTLSLVESIPAKSEAYEFRFPRNASEFERIVGPEGTEFVFLCGHRDEPIGVEDLKSISVFQEVWPALPAQSLIGLGSEGVEVLQADRGFGGGVETRDPQTEVRERMKRLHGELGRLGGFGEGVAFAHLDEE